MKIHFVCTGNLYRSPMADAYLRSKQIPGLEVSSSGILATPHLDNYAQKLARWVLDKEGLGIYIKKGWDRTTKELIEKQDLVVFMQENHFVYSRDELGATPKMYEIWNVLDRTDTLTNELENDEIERPLAEKKFEEIVKNVDELVKKIKIGEIDAV